MNYIIANILQWCDNCLDIKYCPSNLNNKVWEYEYVQYTEEEFSRLLKLKAFW